MKLFIICIDHVWKKSLMILWYVFTIQVYIVFSMSYHKNIFNNLGYKNVDLPYLDI
jgi:hypothetical protein